MSDQALYCDDHVNQPYPRVRDLLLADPYLVLRRAIATGPSQTGAPHFQLAGLDLATEAEIEIVGIENDDTYRSPATKISLEWRDAKNLRLFPVLKAELRVFAASPTQTALELRGSYQSSVSDSGDPIDAAAEQLLIEASATRFLQRIASWLREQLGSASAAATVEAPAPQREPVVDLEC